MRSGNWVINVKVLSFFLLEGSSLSIERNQGMQLVELDDQGAVVGSTYHKVMEDSCNAENYTLCHGG